MTKFLVIFMVYHLINHCAYAAPGAHAALQNVADSIVLFLKGQAPGAIREFTQDIGEYGTNRTEPFEQRVTG